MSLSKNRTLRVRILVKAFPQPSKAHEETVCCAGITDDGREMLRLFPIRFRRLPREHQFDRFDLLEMTATKASDPRPESFRVDEGSIRLIERGNKLSDAARIQLWQPFITRSLTQLHTENRASNRSLGIIRPDPGSLKFIVKPAKDADAEDRQIADQVLQMQQSSLLEAPLTPLEKPELAFVYRYTSDGQRHEHMIHDWEVQEAHRQYKRKYGAAALDHLKRMYGETIPAGNLHFIMGTMAAHPRTFIVIGLLRSALDPAELARQGALF
ncbi:MAG: hypothetical protein ACREU3_10475 [Steroidobacteraceae bacterium]